MACQASGPAYQRVWCTWQCWAECVWLAWLALGGVRRQARSSALAGLNQGPQCYNPLRHQLAPPVPPQTLAVCPAQTASSEHGPVPDSPHDHPSMSSSACLTSHASSYTHRFLHRHTARLCPVQWARKQTTTRRAHQPCMLRTPIHGQADVQLALESAPSSRLNGLR